MIIITTRKGQSAFRTNCVGANSEGCSFAAGGFGCLRDRAPKSLRRRLCERSLLFEVSRRVFVTNEVSPCRRPPLSTLLQFYLAVNRETWRFSQHFDLGALIRDFERHYARQSRLVISPERNRTEMRECRRDYGNPRAWLPSDRDFNCAKSPTISLRDAYAPLKRPFQRRPSAALLFGRPQ